MDEREAKRAMAGLESQIRADPKLRPMAGLVPLCPECGSEDVAAGDLVASGQAWKCKDCGREFQAGRGED